MATQPNETFEQVISIQIFKQQLKDIDKLVGKYPYVFNNRSHFFRASANYFISSIKNGKFKLNNMEDEIV